LEGSFKDTKVNLLYAIIEVLKNAFIQALQPTIDQQINIGSVGNSSTEELHKNTGTDPPKEVEKKDDEKEKKGLLKRIFNKKDKNKNEENKASEENKTTEEKDSKK
jgi:hypothetical protein